ncbi:MAG: hypothetical protein ACI8ZM_002647 [Crocinitomix sp.]|jgi:uncharacterized protein YndB with AHSA1/START domain
MDITFELSINASAATIYNAVATQNGINNWWAKAGTVGEAAGESSELIFDKQGTIVKMGFKTLSLLPNKEVVWECTENPNPAWLGTEVITKIEESTQGCNVIFSHAKFDEKWKGQDPFEMTKQGWEHFTQSLISYCETGQGQPW